MNQTSTTYDAFMYMSLPVPSGKTKVVIQELIDEFVKAEVMEKENAWYALSLPRRPLCIELTVFQVLSSLQNQPSRFQNTNHRPSSTCTAHPTQTIHNAGRSLLGQVRDARHLPHQRSRSYTVLARTCRFVNRKWKAGGAGWNV